MNRRFGFSSTSVAVLTGFLVAAGVQVFSGGDFALTAVGGTVTQGPSGPGLLFSQNLVYEGAFRIPQGSGDPQSANWGGECMSYNPGGNNGTGSLLICGMSTYKTIGEISVPAPVISSQLSSLPVANFVNPFTDVLQGHSTDIYGNDPNASVAVGGVLVHNGRMIVSVYGYFDTMSQLHPNSHFVASPNVGQPQFMGGPYQVGNPAMAGFVAGYMTRIPAAYQAQLGGPFLTGQCCLNIIGRTSSGPSATVFNPDDVGRTNPVPAKRVLGYPITNPTLGDWEGRNGVVNPKLYDGASRAVGAVFPENSRSVLFFGRLGVGQFCYGEMTSDPALHGVVITPGLIYCYDPTSSGKGSSSYPYKFLVWAYDVNDLIAVKNGSKADYQVVPYTTWEFTLPTMYPGGAASKISLGSTAYDPGSNRIFVTQKFVDNFGTTIVHVYKVNNGATAQGLCLQ